MKYYVKTTDETGKRIPIDAVNEKRKAVKEKIIAMGMQYVETEAIIGRLDAAMNRVEERVYVIEMVARDFYV